MVEDDELIQRMYVRVFTKAGFEVKTANDGEQGILAASEFMPDLIIMDVMMPNLNGIQALEAIKGNDSTKAIPVIMLSADDDGTLMMKAMQLGANRFLVKSAFEPNQVVGIVKSVLNG